MKLNNLNLALLLILLFAIFSCTKSSKESSSKDEVLLPSTTLSESRKVTVPDMTIENGRLTWGWKDAMYFSDFYEVPFELNGKVPRPKSQKTGIIQGRSHLLISRKPKDNIVFVVKYIPSKDYKGNINTVNSQNFSTVKFDGIITLSKIGENTIRVMEINDGKVIKSSKHKKASVQTNAGARISGCTFWEQVTDWYSCSGGECYYNYTSTEYWQECDGDSGGGGSGGDCSADPLCNGYGVGTGSPVVVLNGNPALAGSPGRKPAYGSEDRCGFAENMWSRSLASGNEYFGVVTKNGEYLITQEQGVSGGNVNGIFNSSDGRVYYYYPRVDGEPSVISQSEPGRIGNVNVWAVEIKATVHTHTPCISDGTDGVSHLVGSDDHALAGSLSSLRHYVIGCNATAEFNGTNDEFYNKGGGCTIIFSKPLTQQ